MSWFSRRLAEPSTRMGGLILAGLATQALTHPPADGQGWAALLLGAFGSFFGMVTPEIASPDNTSGAPLK